MTNLRSACVVGVLLGSAAAACAGAQDVRRCDDAARFMTTSLQMEAIVDTQTVDDWRTRQKLRGCRITAAATTALPPAQAAARFYERVRDAGWSRTPDPQDAPRESSLRFRKGRTDCLFNVYSGASLLTDAETEVSERVTPARGESRYNVFVMCMPALDAAAR